MRPGDRSLDEVVGAVPGQTLRAAAGDRHHVDVDVAVVVAAERDGCTVRRELRPRLQALGGRQPIRAAAVAIRHPYVAIVDEGDVPLADVRLREHQRVVSVNGERGRAPQCEQASGREQTWHR